MRLRINRSVIQVGRPRKTDRIFATIDTPATVGAEHFMDADAATRARAGLPDPELVADMSKLFAALSDPTRIRIIAALASDELCVSDVAATVGLGQSAVSHQLRSLREIGLVRPRRSGRMVYYRLDDEHVTILFTQALKHVTHQRAGGG